MRWRLGGLATLCLVLGAGSVNGKDWLGRPTKEDLKVTYQWRDSKNLCVDIVNPTGKTLVWVSLHISGQVAERSTVYTFRLHGYGGFYGEPETDLVISPHGLRRECFEGSFTDIHSHALPSSSISEQTIKTEVEEARFE